VRTFIAAPLPPDVRDTLAHVQRDLAAFHAEVRWTAPASIHLTLKFLGEVEPLLVTEIAQDLRAGVAGFGRLRLQIRGLGGFPSLRSPRVLWCGLEGEVDRLASLHRTVEEIAGRHGFAREDRAFQPHLTLGRVNGRGNLRALTEHMGSTPAFEHPFEVAALHVYRSRLRPTGAVYDVVEELPLAPP